MLNKGGSFDGWLSFGNFRMKSFDLLSNKNLCSGEYLRLSFKNKHEKQRSNKSTSWGLKGHSSQVFHSGLKCWDKPKIHSHQIWSFDAFLFSRYYSLKLAVSSYFSVAILSVSWQKIKFWKAGLHLLKSSYV